MASSGPRTGTLRSLATAAIVIVATTGIAAQPQRRPNGKRLPGVPGLLAARPGPCDAFPFVTPATLPAILCAPSRGGSSRLPGPDAPECGGPAGPADTPRGRSPPAAPDDPGSGESSPRA